MNTFIPDDWSQYTDISTAVGSLVAPFNPKRIAEMVNEQFNIPPVAYLGTHEGDTLIRIGLPNTPIPPTQQDIDVALDKLNAICTDPTRNDQTADQQEEADIVAERALIITKINQAVADRDSIQLVETGLKDRITGNADLGVLGINDRLRNNVFNAPEITNAQKIEILRVQVLELTDIARAILNIVVDILQAVLYLLREKKRDIGG